MSCSALWGISTHALREEGDVQAAASDLLATLFLPTPSARRATHNGTLHYDTGGFISTHALREEGDR